MPALRVLRPALWTLIVAATVLQPSFPVEAALPQGESSGPPNVLIVMTDDQRAEGTMQVMPFTRSWFGQGGVTYPRAYATTPLCCPARSTVMTGRYAHNTGVVNNQSALAIDQRSTVQRYLHEAGYRTGMFGKFLNQWPLERAPAFFDRFAVFGGGYYNTEWNENGTIKNISRYSTRFISSRARAFVQEAEADDAQPWFLLVTTSAPHRTAVAEPAYEDVPVGRWAGNPAVAERDRTDKPPLVQSHWHRTLGDGRRVRNDQLRSLMSVDDMVEELVGVLRANGEEQDTLAFFLSDNGVLWSEHGIYGKTWPYPQSTQIPLILRWPGHVPAAKTDGRIAATIDLAPTILEAAGVTADAEYPIDGRSLLTGAARNRLLLEFWRTSDSRTTPWAGYIAKDFLYAEYLEEDLSRPFFREYYHLPSDPWQLVNLLGDGDPANNPDVAQLSEDLGRDRTCVGSACP